MNPKGPTAKRLAGSFALALDCFASLAMTLEFPCLNNPMPPDEIINALALAVAAFYSGAPLYVNLVEQPALRALADGR